MKQKQGANNTYFGNLWEGIYSSWVGLRLSWKHLLQARKRRMPLNIADNTYFAQETGRVTIQYPYEAIPVPDNGRYRLYNEMDDCIVCDKCAKICPVDCIEIEAIKATEQVGVTSDGSPIRLYAGKFDIDMAKCCFCGLCTTVCPTDCLTMTKAYDFSEENISNMIYHFANISPQEAEEKKQLLAQFQKEKAEAKKATEKTTKPAPTQTSTAKPAFKPKPKPSPEVKPLEQKAEETPAEAKPKPVFKPKIKPKINPTDSENNQDTP